MKKVLALVTKATSSLDYLLPLVLRSRALHPDWQWSILFWGSIDSITKGQKTYLELLKGQAEVFSLEDFTGPFPFQALSFADKASQGFLSQASGTFLCKRILKKFKPDLVLFDHREGRYPFLDQMKKEVVRENVFSILMPHAPHHTGVEAFVRFSDWCEMPDRSEYWMPFIHDRYSSKSTVPADRFVHVGYPGLDSDWLEKLKAISATPRKKVHVLLMARKIFPPGVREFPPGHDHFAFFYDEFQNLLKGVDQAVSEIFPEYEICIKPHPSTDRELLKEICKGFEHVGIANDSIYGLLNHFDIFLSFYTTTILVPLIAGKPSFVIDSRIQNEIRPWPELKDLYEDPSFFAKDFAELKKHLKVVRDNGSAEKQRLQTSVQHVRKFFPDRASDKALLRMTEVLK